MVLLLLMVEQHQQDYPVFVHGTALLKDLCQLLDCIDREVFLSELSLLSWIWTKDPMT